MNSYNLFALEMELRLSEKRDGSLSVKQPYLKESLPEASLAIMRSVKKIFGSNNILNLGKICYAPQS